ncbi:peptide/nickel transport system ATP-binding protein [Winogradskyella epiphytica]|uniref:Peptide/nickel transport system ATP-binding protein n=1 Tax=Winogradskyella epiphytica TaxID=262005 RepID=A0A2V4X0N4_9FLAO|nr:ABC transporter ATP-binding protein [Winogradskyella epiphytica]PYE83238.1 peptide/nickel transport system ATP-binding protein [Winogradskyella epiphytica]GGW56769.1 ABC transporter ATP-binding protein [Winogradskyella epiphytica]
MAKDDLLKVEGLEISFFKDKIEKQIIKNISFEIQTNEIVAVVGESGSGKSISSLALMGLLPKQISKITSGSITFDNKNLVSLSERDFQSIRGQEIAMIFQEPMSSLNPSMRCGRQVEEILQQHLKLSASEIKTEVINLFDKVKLPYPERMYKAYPHEISGGQKQRVMIAMAIACKPKLLIADEPTTALDVTVQKEILELLKDIQKDTKMSILFISHDLSLVSELADRVLVMYQGEIVEQGTTNEIFNSPKNNYTKALIAARPSTDYRLKQLPTISDFMTNKVSDAVISDVDRRKNHEKLYAQAPLIEIINVEKTYFSKTGWFSKDRSFNAVDGVSFKVYPGETLGLVGESGCGKSTLGNAILQLDKATSGQILYKGKEITNLSTSEMRALRKDIQIIFQDPFASLNPRLTVGNAIIEPMKVHNIGTSNASRKEKVIDILEKVGLDASAFDRYPHEFSGGQRQRVGIARTIALEPQLIVCDESVSALDISVQAQVLNLLNDLKHQFGFTYIFISHDLAVVKYMADQLLVMNKGKIEEIGDADKIYASPKKEYTKKLIHAIPKGL